MPKQITNRKRSLIFVNIMITSVATTLLMTALNTALAPITEALEISVSLGQWLISGYSLIVAIVMPMSAFLIRRVQTKRLYIFGIGLFCIGLLIDTVCPNFLTMMVGRAFQAMGNGIILSMTQVVILTIYPPEKRGSAMGWYGLAITAAPVIAPTLGGILVDLISWRAIFGLTLILMVISLVMSVLVFENVLETGEEKFDLPSFLLSIFAFGGITLGIGNLASYGITSPLVWLSLAVGIATAIVFVRRQLHLPKPFLDIRIMKWKGYTVGVLACFLMYAVTMASSVLVPLYVQSIMGRSATFSGLLVLPGGLASAIISPIAGKLYDKIGIKKMFVPGALVMCVSTVGLIFVSMETPMAIVSILYLLRCVSYGFLMMPMITWACSWVAWGSPSALSDASALISSLRTIGGSMGSAVFTGIMSMVAVNSASVYGEAAQMHGFNLSCLWLTLLPVILIVLAVFFTSGAQPGED